MPLQSMTGFSRTTQEIENCTLIWEAKSVNGKSLDIRFRSPIPLDVIETNLRKIVSQYVSRGTIHLSLSVVNHNASSIPSINKDFLEALVQLANELHEKYGLEKPSIDGLLNVKGVFENEQTFLTFDQEAFKISFLSFFEKNIKELVQARCHEGAALKDILLTQLDEIKSLLDKARYDPSRSTEAIEERLKKQVAALIDTNSSFDKERLHMEAVLLATRTDIQEELDRLDGHIVAAKTILSSNRVVGRKLDFLAQEFNREVNTLCSKAHTLSISEIGLALKFIIDQWREQIQNLE